MTLRSPADAWAALRAGDPDRADTVRRHNDDELARTLAHHADPVLLRLLDAATRNDLGHPPPPPLP